MAHQNVMQSRTLCPFDPLTHNELGVIFYRNKQWVIYNEFLYTSSWWKILKKFREKYRKILDGIYSVVDLRKLRSAFKPYSKCSIILLGNHNRQKYVIWRHRTSSWHLYVTLTPITSLIASFYNGTNIWDWFVVDMGNYRFQSRSLFAPTQKISRGLRLVSEMHTQPDWQSWDRSHVSFHFSADGQITRSDRTLSCRSFAAIRLSFCGYDAEHVLGKCLLPIDRFLKFFLVFGPRKTSLHLYHKMKTETKSHLDTNAIRIKFVYRFLLSKNFQFIVSILKIPVHGTVFSLAIGTTSSWDRHTAATRASIQDLVTTI